MSFTHSFQEKKNFLDDRLSKTRKNIFSKIARAIVGKNIVDEDVLDHLEEILIVSDVGVKTTLKIIKQLQIRITRCKYVGTSELMVALEEEIVSLLQTNCFEKAEGEKMEGSILGESKPHVIMVVGVNGVGKTTTVGKLAYHYKKMNRKVFLGAADTFRAAAIDQLNIWSERVGVPIIKQKMGADSAAVVHDTLMSAIAHHADVVIIDTAGRFHNKIGLMNELSKIKKVMQKIASNSLHEILLILDGSVGQNAYNQVKEFSEAVGVTALAITKLDGTAKGGVVIGISDQLQIPIKYIGIGEGLEDLRIFREKEFVHSLFRSE